MWIRSTEPTSSHQSCITGWIGSLVIQSKRLHTRSWVSTNINWGSGGHRLSLRRVTDSDGEFKEHTVIRILAFPITVYHLNTCSPFLESHPMATTCVMQHNSVPHVPFGCEGQAPVPSILPMACLWWKSTHQDTRRSTARGSLPSWPPPQPRAASISLVRKWQTRAVDPGNDGACRIDFRFTIPCKFLLKVECL